MHTTYTLVKSAADRAAERWHYPTNRLVFRTYRRIMMDWGLIDFWEYVEAINNARGFCYAYYD